MFIYRDKPCTPGAHGMNENLHHEELQHFEEHAVGWWDRDGDFRTLHQLNPLRANYIDEHSPVAGKKVLDVGCGGGLLSEALAQRGGELTGIDLGERALETARAHCAESGLSIEYLRISASDLAQGRPAGWDVVCCMELLEHVPDPAALVRDCAALCAPGGALYFSTIDRSPLSWLLAVVAGEYMLGLLPRGTHQYEKFIRPAELAAWIRDAGLHMQEIRGVQYQPLLKEFQFRDRVLVNYMARAIRT